MAQTFPTSAQVIYETLAADTSLMDLIGSYEFKEGQIIDALSIVTAGEDLPSLRSVQGVECIVQDSGTVKQQNYYDKTDLITTWSIFLVSWPPSNGATLQNATDIILRRFLGSEAVQVVQTTDGLGSLVQNKILIKSNMPILAAS